MAIGIAGATLVAAVAARPARAEDESPG